MCSVKRNRLAEWIQKQDPYILCLQETHPRPRDTYRLKVKEQKKILSANRNQKKEGVVILTSDKIDFTINTTTKKKPQRRMLHNDKKINPKKDIAIIKTYAPKIGAP